MRSQVGAYGFRLVWSDADEPPSDLVALNGGTPEVEVYWRPGSMLRSFEIVGDDRVVLGAERASGFVVQREPAAIAMNLHEDVSIDALLHPLLTVPLSVLARWRGDVTLHAGAFETEGGAWAVVGEREAGKSSALAGLSQRGHPIVADDLLTLSGRDVWAGPSCVDLRPQAVEHFPAARVLGEVGGRLRYRLSTPPGRTRLPLRGMFVLAWHDEAGVSAEPLSAQDRLGLLYMQEYMGMMGPNPPAVLFELMELPMWRLSRPRDWETAEAALERMLEIAQA
jgi:hypothetical protein